MKLLPSIVGRQVVRHYPRKEPDLEFTIEGLKCHKDDEHTFTASVTEEEVPPFACSFNKSLLRGNLLAVADEDGGIYLFDLRKKCADSMLKGWIAHSNAIFDLAWIDHEPKLVTASGDQTAQLWDIQHSTRLAVFRGHTSSLKSVDFQEDSQFVFATGARDGNIMIWDVRCNKRDGYYQPVNTIRNCHSTLSHGTGSRKKRKRSSNNIVNVRLQDSQQSVTSVKYQDRNKIVSAGAVDGNIKVWDLRKNYSTIRTEPVPFHVFPYPGSGTRKHGFSSLVFDSHKSRLFANCTNDIIYMYDCMSFKNSTPLCSFQGHSNTTFYVKSAISPDDQFLLSGSGDCNAYIWNINKPHAAPFNLVGHSGEVTSVAWCPQDQAKIATCSDDNNLKVWRVNFEKEDKSPFIGLCERKPCSNLKPITDVQSKPSTPNSSPSRSGNSSTTSSPVSLSPNPSKCSSPQQVLQTWLKSNASKRPRETDDETNKNKRYCLEPSRDGINNLDANEDLYANASQSTCPGIITQTSYKDTKEFVTGTFALEVNKENIEVMKSVKITQPDKHEISKELHPKVEEEKSLLERTSPLPENTETCCYSNSEHFNGDKMKSSFVTKSLNGKRLKRDINVELCGKNMPCQPTSPLITMPTSPDKEFEAILKHMRCIKDYFKPMVVKCEDQIRQAKIVKDKNIF